jgi:MFS family permease
VSLTAATQPASVRGPAVVYFLLFGALAAYFPYIAVFFQSIGLSLAAIGLLAALSSAVAVVAAPIWGAVVDRRRDVRRPIAVAAVWSALAAAWLATARDPIVVAAAVIVLAAGSAGLAPMLDSRTIEIVGSSRDRYGRARAWGSLAFTLFALGVGVLLDRTGPGGLFLVYASGLALTGVAAFVLLDGPRTVAHGLNRVMSTGFGSGLAGLVGDTTLLLLFIGVAGVWTAVAAVTTFLSVHLIDLGADSALVGLVWTPGALVEVPLMLAFPAIARRVPSERLLVLGALAYAARAAGWAVVSEPWLYVAIAPLGGFGYALFYVGTVTYVSRAVPSTVQATAQGIFSGTAFSLGTILGSVIGGQLAARLTIAGMFGVAAAATVVAGLVVLWATEARKTAPRG